jgi:hypothetical protein
LLWANGLQSKITLYARFYVLSLVLMYSHVVTSTRVWPRLEPGAALMNSIASLLKYSLLLPCRYVVIQPMRSSGLKIFHMCKGVRSKRVSFASCHKFIWLTWFAVKVDFTKYIIEQTEG